MLKFFVTCRLKVRRAIIAAYLPWKMSYLSYGGVWKRFREQWPHISGHAYAEWRFWKAHSWERTILDKTRYFDLVFFLFVICFCLFCFKFFLYFILFSIIVYIYIFYFSYFCRVFVCSVFFFIEEASERHHLSWKLVSRKIYRGRIMQTTWKKLETKKASLQVNSYQRGKKVYIRKELQ